MTAGRDRVLNQSRPDGPVAAFGASWLDRHCRVAKAGVEGTGTYGLGLQRVLQGRGIEVVEVNRPDRQQRRSRGKSDTVDPEAAACAMLGGHATVVPGVPRRERRVDPGVARRAGLGPAATGSAAASSCTTWC